MNDARAERLFRSSMDGKRRKHWLLCLASAHVSGLQTRKLAEEYAVSTDTIYAKSRSYRLYRAIRRRYARMRFVGIGRDPKRAAMYEKEYRRAIRDIRQLRQDLDYSKWLIVANAWESGFDTKEGRRRLTLPEALDALRSGADGNVQQFAAFVRGVVMTKLKVYRRADKALFHVLTYPMSRKDKRVLKRAQAVVGKLLKLEEV